MTMTNKNIQAYLDRYLLSEYNIKSPFRSNGELERDFILLNELANKQNIIIKLMTRQQDLSDKKGIARLWIELQNTLWRKLVGDPYAKYEKFIEQEADEANIRFAKFCKKLGNSNEIERPEIPGRIFIDVTNTSQSEYFSGIQRVVFEVTRKLASNNVHPAFFNKHGLFIFDSSTKKIVNIKFRKNDILILADCGLDYQDSIVKAMSDNHFVGGKNIVFLYDLIPLNFPLTCGKALPYKFYWWLKNCAFKSDLILCNTQTVADQARFIADEFTTLNSYIPKIEVFPLGSNINICEHNKPSDMVLNLLRKNLDIFLSVGTIEPRKGYSISLDAVEKLWQENKDFIFVIAGRYGWNQDSVRQRILNNSEYGKRLIWLNDASDADLSILYESSKALIFSSIEEGFGLPLIEASQYGLPIIASDIPVFREICGINARYFEVANAQKLSEQILAVCEAKKTKNTFYSATWNDTKDIIIRKIKDIII